jgi:hypothetical protein
MIGLELTLWTAAVGGGGGVPQPDVFVDSVNGNDANDGLTLGTALQTLAAAQTAVTARGNGTVLGLARGSYWREQFNITIDAFAVVPAGSGNIPVIDGADIATGWTEHADGASYPDVWQLSWNRTSATTTSSENIGVWADGTMPRVASSLADLQTNGGWFASNFTTQSTTIYIKSVADPNSSGVVYEITKRHYGFAGHPATLGLTKSGQRYFGPIEIKRCVGHYNALSQGPGLAQRMLLRQGNIHHSVAEGNQTDVLSTEYNVSIAPAMNTFYRAVSSGFAPVVTRGLCLSPGGSGRVRLNGQDASAFYAHGSSGSIDSLTVNGCVSRGCTFAGADATVLTVNGGYAEDAPTKVLSLATAGVSNNNINYLQHNETAASPFSNSNACFFTNSANPIITAKHCVSYQRLGGCVNQATPGSTRHFYENCSFVVPASIPMSGGLPDVRYCVLHGGRSYNTFLVGYTGDYNVFYFVGNPAPQFQYNSVVYGSLSTFQAATGQDANSVFLKHADQVSGNGIAFWLGLASGVNNGPVDGDFRINPAARVYNGAGTQLSGVFADGVTPITMAGPQGHWDFNERAIASGPPTRWPTLPADVAEMRAYVEDPAGWDFYP